MTSPGAPLRYSVVLPVFNEGPNIGDFCRKATAELPAGYELLVCYDFEADDTLPALAALPAEDKPPLTRLVRNDLGRGVRYAIEAGMRSAAAPVVVVMMADLSDDFSKVEKMVSQIEAGADVVCASRYMRGGRQIGGPRLKGLMSRTAGLMLYWLAGLPTHDPTNSFKAYRREFLSRTPIQSTVGFSLGLELTVKAHFAGGHVAEVPATWLDRTAGQSRFRLWAWLPHYLRWFFWALWHSWLGPMHRSIRTMWGLLAAGLLIRLALAAVSIGTNDALTFGEFGKEVRLFGVLGTYRVDPWFNHPPLVGCWAAVVLKLIGAPELRPWAAFSQDVNWAFSFIFKLPVIAADGLGCWLLWMRWRPHLGAGRAAAIAAAFSWSLVSILVSGFHGNTDPVYVALALAAVWLMEDRRAFFWSGLALAAAINVKIIPVLLLPALLLSCRSRQQTRAFCGGVAIGLAPFVPPVCLAFPEFCRNVLSYNPGANAWGIEALPLLASRVPHLADLARHVMDGFHSCGRFLMLGLILAWAAAACRWRRWDRYEVAAVTFALFLVFTPGFGVQYAVAPGLLLFAARPGLALSYALAAGALLLEVYYTRWVPHQIPIRSLLIGSLSPAQALLGLPAWGILVYFLATTVLRSERRTTDTERASGDWISTDQPSPLSAPISSERCFS